MSQRNNAKHPDVTAIMPARDEEQTISAAIDSLLDQGYPGSLSVVVAVAPSVDRTREVVSEIAEQTSRVRLVDNAAGSTPAGLNAAIAEAHGAVIVRCDAHSEMPRDYVARAVETLERTGAVNVGGIQYATGIGAVQRAVAAAMSSPFGVGDARFHTGGPSGDVDTVYLGVFRRDALEAVGGFDESLVRNQDYELNYRLRTAGGRVFFDPSLKVVYRPRSTLRALGRQYFEYGVWKRIVIRRHPGSARWRQLVAPAFVVGLGASAVAGIAGRRGVASIVPASYAIATLAVTSLEIARRRDAAMLLLPAVFPTMHVAWGVGFLTSRQSPTSES